VGGVRTNQPPVFRGRHFQDELIVLCVRWYLRYSLSYRDLEELMAERSLKVDHSTIARWVVRYAPILNERMRRHLRRPNRSWRVDETYVRVAGKWTYLYRALDSEGKTIDFMLSPCRDRAVEDLPMPPFTLYEQHHRARSPLHQEAYRCQSVVSLCARRGEHNPGIRSNAHDSQGTDPVVTEG
jgi:DDE domain